MPYKVTTQEELCIYCDLCITNCFPAVTAVRGLEALFPYLGDNTKRRFGNIQAAGEQFLPGVPRYLALRDIVFAPNLLDTPRVQKRDEIDEEPLYIHVKTESEIGGFKLSVPLIMAAMGSTDIANSRGIDAGLGAAETGTVYVIGENVMNMRGYDKPTKENQPTLKKRILSYLEHNGHKGGVVIQQNVEDTRAGVWRRIYNDPELREYFKQGLIGFEAKGGQGAKPGMGGEVKVDRKLALRLIDKYHFPVDPNKVEEDLYQRHSVPGTMTAESMKSMLEQTIEEFPDAHLWFKTGPYGDLMAQIQVLDEVARTSGKRINLTIDGAEGGTGMSPLGPMNEMGVPTLVCLGAIAGAKANGYTNIDYTIAGGLFRGDHLAKALALGADATAIGRGINISIEAGRKKFAAQNAGEEELAKAGAKGLANYFGAVADNARMLVSSLGKYDLSSLHEEPVEFSDGTIIKSPDVVALNGEVAKMFGILYAYDPKIWKKLSEMNQVRKDKLRKEKAEE